MGARLCPLAFHCRTVRMCGLNQPTRNADPFQPSMSSTVSASTARIRRTAMITMGVLIGITLPTLVTGRAPLAFLFPAIALIAIARVWRLRREIFPRLWPLPPLVIAVAAMMASFAVSSIWTLDPVGSPRAWLEVLGILIVGGLIYLALEGEERTIDIALKAMVVASVFAFILVYVTIFISPQAMSPIRLRHIENVHLARQAMKAYGSVMPLMIPLLIWCGWRLGGKWRWAAWLLIPPNIATIPILQAKAGLLGLAGAVAAVGYCWLLLKLAPRIRAFLVVATVAVAVGAAAYLVPRLPDPPYKGPESLKIPTYVIDAHRQIIWGFTIRFADDRPFFGYGLDTAGRFPGAKIEIPGFQQEYVPGHPHNWVIQVIVETGWIGFLFALAAIFFLLRRIWLGLVDGHSGAWVAAAGAGAFFLSSLVNFNIWAVWWQGVFFLLLSLSLSAVPRRSKLRETSPAPQAS